MQLYTLCIVMENRNMLISFKEFLKYVKPVVQ